MARRYFFGPGEDAPVLDDPGNQLACTNGTRFLHADHQGSIIALADCWGNRTNVNSYDEYGIPGAGNSGRFQQTDPIGYDDGSGCKLDATVDCDSVLPCLMTIWQSRMR